MSINFKTVLLASALIVPSAMLSSANAQSNADGARAAWAERHIQQVCRPLAASGLKARAARCHQNVARAKADPTIDFREVTASLPPARSAEVAPQAAPAGMNRCVGVSCIARFPMIGVGY
jgi:hypothetical protein